MSKPCLQKYTKPEKLSDYPAGTAFKAGHLVTKNSGWRILKPVIEPDKCKSCLQCYMYCPDGVIFKTGSKVDIDYDFCKGCGICAKICTFGAIEMVKEG